MQFDWLRDRSGIFSRDIVRFCRSLPHDDLTRQLARQLQAAGTSVAANYHACCRARSRAEFIAKIGIVVEEADEAVFWLSTMKESHIASGADVDVLLQEARELRAIFARSRSTAVHNAARARKASHANRGHE
ncbi:MAG: four helix bundle protein [Vicinamibacterales bacterium]